MKSLSQYIMEAIRKLSPNTTGIIVFDIDDTLLKVDSKKIAVYKRVPGQPKEIRLSTEDFAKDPDAADPSKRSWFDYREFNDPQKIYDSIMSATPLVKNLKIMDSYIHAGYDFCFLTARSCEEVIKQALDDFLMVRNRETQQLSKLGSVFKKSLSSAINDESKHYRGQTDADKKSKVLAKLCKKYDRVVFVDDDIKNVKAARDLHLPNLSVIKAWED